ncbi:precorrin-6y C5,15-methyltransferase (decarboxylating) subunit CbiE [Streptomyces sp. NPDC016675]|uniref:precorrin-6y C5,15-methyltransferase (decarboxylating) subunit CbiE n=1 Tax=Streptomyces sp. NPDC016675 TaxID=3364970 RepID=UPI0036FC2CB4
MITVVGMGAGEPPAGDVAAGAALVVGGRRHLDAVRLPAGAERVVLGALAPALDTVAEYVAEERPVVVLASGDPGFFGIVRALAERFGPERLDVRPGVSSVAAAFARAGLPWDDAVVASAHGRDLRTAVNVCRAYPKVAVLTGPGAGPAELGAALRGDDRVLVVARALGSAGERVERVTPAEAAGRDWGAAVSVVLCLDEARALGPARTIAGARGGRGEPDPHGGPDVSVAPDVPARPDGPVGPDGPVRPVRGAGPGGGAGWALDETEFAHRDSMITKFEVRALALARLGPRPGDLVWDVGAGSGSVAVECARLGAAVDAVEKTPDGVERIRANAVAHGVDVRVVHGTAPGALSDLADPDAVFVGGGGHELPAVVAACARRARRAVVVALAALDRVPAARRALLDAGLECDGVLLQSSRLAPLPGDVTRLAAANPVFLLWGVRPHSRTEGVSP